MAYLSEIEIIDVLDVEVLVLKVELVNSVALGQVVVELGQLSSH